MDTAEQVLALLLDDQVEQAHQAVSRLNDTLRSMILDGLNVDTKRTSHVRSRAEQVKRLLGEVDSSVWELNQRRYAAERAVRFWPESRR